MPDYRVLISPITDPSAFSAELPFSSLSWTETLSDVGEASVSIPLRGAGPAVTPTNFGPGKTCLWVERNGSLRWGGIVWTLDGSVSSNELNVTAADFHSYARRRTIRTTKTYTAQDQLVIARDLIDTMEAVGGSLGLIQTTEATTSGVNRDRSFAFWERKSFGEAIEQLGAVENGFDWRYEVAYVAGVPTVEFRTQYPNLGRRTSYIFDLGANVELLSFTMDGSALVNQADAIGVGEGPDTLIATAFDSSALTEYPLYQDVETFSDISVASTLADHAGRAIERGSAAITQYQVRISPDGPPSIGSYQVGDIVELRGNYGFLDATGDYRIVQLGYGVGSEGETVDATLTNLEAFDR